jgi:antitoxin component YwqK of YwqJK toxin-antitoxin module
MKKQFLFTFLVFLNVYIFYSQNTVSINSEFDFVYPDKVDEPNEIEPNRKLFKDSLENGKWIANSKYENDYCLIEVKNRVIDGTFFYRYSDGQIKWKIIYKSGKKAGIWQRFSKNNELIDEIPYEDDLVNGQIKKYENGKLSGFLDYQNGIENGKFVGYNENGNLSFNGTFVNGKREGQFFHYGEDGFLYLIEFYKSGELIKKKIIKRKKRKK